MSDLISPRRFYFDGSEVKRAYFNGEYYTEVKWIKGADFDNHQCVLVCVSGEYVVSLDKECLENLEEDWAEVDPPLAAPAPSAHASPSAGDDAPRIDLNADTLEHWPRMFRERCTADHWKDLYNDAAKNDMLDALDVIATLQAALTAAQEREARLRSENDDLLEFYDLMVSLDAQNEAIEKLAQTMYEDDWDLRAWADLKTVCERLRDARKAQQPRAAGGGTEAGDG